MARADLLALSADDLIALTNRGTVNRAQREVTEQTYTADVVETEAGDVTVKWSDNSECHLPAGVVLRDARCSCAAVGLCRHLVRSVLAYQRYAAQASPGGAAPQALEPWDPGTITDEELARYFTKRQLATARKEYESGLLVELVRGVKPSARFHIPPNFITFQVPGDIGYSHCDCAAKKKPCEHALLAVWAFRKLEPEKKAGIVASAEQAMPPPVQLLDELENTVHEFPEIGVSGLVSAFTSRLSRLEAKCREADMAWPADILAELIQQHTCYVEHDARFEPEHVAVLLGELLIRSDAIRNDTRAISQVLIRGNRVTREQELAKARLVGLGCGVHVYKRSVRLNVYMQDTDTGIVVVVRDDDKQMMDKKQSEKTFADLAQKTIKQVTYASLGVKQLLVAKATRLASNHLTLPRLLIDSTAQPQAFTWENLRPPVLVEEFAELDARLSALPPSSLRPRRVAEDFHVCKVARVEAADFDAALQTVFAILSDERGQQALLQHPYTSRGRAGAETLLARLRQMPQQLRFVSGPVQRSARGLVIHPVCVVFQDGDNRVAVQPWVEARSEAATVTEPTEAARWGGDPLLDYLHQVQTALGDLLLLGLTRADRQSAKQWRELQQTGEAVGFARLARLAARLADELEAKSRTLEWDWRPASEGVLRLATLTRMAQDLVN